MARGRFIDLGPGQIVLNTKKAFLFMPAFGDFPEPIWIPRSQAYVTRDGADEAFVAVSEWLFSKNEWEEYAP